MVAGDQNVGKRLVVAKLHVEARAQLLDQVRFQQQRFGFGHGRDNLDIGGRGDHAQDARRQRRASPRVGGQALFDVLGLADIEHVVGGVEHAVDAGRGGGEPHRVLDRRMSRRQPAFGDGFRAFLGEFRQPRFLVVLGARRRRVDVGSHILRRAGLLRRHVAGGTGLALAHGRRRRMIAGIVFHGAEFMHCRAASPADGDMRRRRSAVTHF